MDEETKQILDKLHEQVQAELATKASYDKQAELYQQSLQATEKLRQAEQARVRRLDEIVERYANQGERNKDTEQLLIMVLDRSSKLIEVFEKSVLNESASREWLEEFSEQITEIKYILLLILSGNSEQKEQMKKRLQQDLLSQHYKNLNTLKLQSAKFGMRPPLDLLNQIEDIENEVARLKDDTET